MNYCSTASELFTNDTLTSLQKWSVFELITMTLRNLLKRKTFSSGEHVDFFISSFQKINSQLLVYVNFIEEPGRKNVVSKYTEYISSAVSSLIENKEKYIKPEVIERRKNKSNSRYSKPRRNFKTNSSAET